MKLDNVDTITILFIMHPKTKNIANRFAGSISGIIISNLLVLNVYSIRDQKQIMSVCQKYRSKFYMFYLIKINHILE